VVVFDEFKSKGEAEVGDEHMAVAFQMLQVIQINDCAKNHGYLGWEYVLRYRAGWS